MMTDTHAIDNLLLSRFGLAAFHPLQREIITDVLQGHDALVLMPTGGGKSLCYQLPALLLPGITLVVSPLIALMKDQVDALRRKGINAAFLNSSIPPFEQRKIEEQALAGELKLLYVAPERFPNERFREVLRKLTVSLIAIDEAHCISQWGHDFRPEYRNLVALREEFPSVPCIALTATATERTRRDIALQLHLKNGKMFTASFNRPNLVYRVLPKRRGAFEALAALLKQEGRTPAILYCLSRKNTEDLAADLQEEGIRAIPYHAGMDALERKRIQEEFLADKIPVITATIAFGMGIDKPDVRTVIHWTMPKDIEGYYQETGRAGRDGKKSECILFFTFGDLFILRRFLLDISDPEVRRHAEGRLQEMLHYAERNLCRRTFLLNYFGEKFLHASCGGCDHCLPALIPLDPLSRSSFDQKERERGERRKKRRVQQKDSTYNQTKMLLMRKLPLTEIARLRGVTIGTVTSHIEELIGVGQSINIEYLRPEKTVFEEIQGAFVRHGREKLNPVFEAFGGKYSYDLLRLVRAMVTLEKRGIPF